MVNTPVVLIVDDETHLRESLSELLSAEGYEVHQASDGQAALTLITQIDPPDVILLDLKMPKLDGLSTLKALRQQPRKQHIPVLIITAFGDSEQTITAMQAGAYDYITKPFDANEVLRSTNRAVHMSRLSREVEQLRAQKISTIHERTGLIGCHPLIMDVFKTIGKVASADATVLITGESGTGKELVAHAIHRHSPRAAAPLLTINCAAIPEDLLESELFGHERGAFTGATQTKPGRLELAEGGTVFLDEIGELSLKLQAKLLRVLQERTIERLGGLQTVPVNFRLLAATNRNLQQLTADGGFREDLFYRLNVVQIHVPPLRSRRSDIPELVEFFLQRYLTEKSNGPKRLTDEAMRLLLRYDFPGNIRELEHLIHRAVLLTHSPFITKDDLPVIIPGATNTESDPVWQELLTLPLEEAVQHVQRVLISRALARTQGNKAEAARLLGIHRQHLYVKLKELGIVPEEGTPLPEEREHP